MKVAGSEMNNLLSSVFQFSIMSSGRDGRDGRKGFVGAQGMPGPKGIHYDLLRTRKDSPCFNRDRKKNVEEWENEKCFEEASDGESLQGPYEILHKLSQVFL